MQMPRMIYGTAWKKERTTDLCVRAVLAGFRGIDTACQPKHYREDLVGAALAKLSKEHNIPRSSLFIQTKFTSLDGQDPSNIPYDPRAPLPEQVRQSFARSLQNLQSDYIDSLVLHSPMPTHAETMTVWRVFEELVASQHVKQLGISNIYNLSALQKLYAEAQVKPSVVQNRFHDRTGYDKGIRAFCREAGMVYQSFWTLTANPHILEDDAVVSVARKRNATPAQVFFRFLIQIGVTPLNGTTDEKHMAEDLAVLEWEDLAEAEVRAIERLL